MLALEPLLKSPAVRRPAMHAVFSTNFSVLNSLYDRVYGELRGFQLLLSNYVSTVPPPSSACPLLSISRRLRR